MKWSMRIPSLLFFIALYASSSLAIAEPNEGFKVGDYIKYEFNGEEKKGVITKIISTAVVEIKFDGEENPSMKPIRRLTLMPRPKVKIKLRKWTNIDGTKSFQGTYVEDDKKTVSIERDNGDVVVIPFERLSLGDRRYIASLSANPEAELDGKKSSEDYKSYRIWSDKTGAYKIKAKYVDQSKKSIKLIREDGIQTTIPYTKFSTYDRAIIRSLDPNHRDFGKPVTIKNPDDKTRPIRERFPTMVEVQFIRKWELARITQVTGPEDAPTSVTASNSRSGFSHEYEMDEVRIIGSQFTILRDLSFDGNSSSTTKLVDGEIQLFDINSFSKKIFDNVFLDKIAAKWDFEIDGKKDASNYSPVDDKRENIEVPAFFNEHDHWTSTAVNRNGLAVVGISPKRFFDKNTQPSLMFVDLKTGEKKEIINFRAAYPVDISDDGNTVLVLGGDGKAEEVTTVFVLRKQNEKYESIAAWNPVHGHRSKFDRIIMNAFLIDDEHCLIQDKEGFMSLWKFPEVKLVWAIETNERVAPCLSPNKKYVAFSASPKGVGSKLILMETMSSEIKAVSKKLSGLNGEFSFRNDGKQLVYCNSSEIIFVNLETGEVGQEIPAGKITTSRNKISPYWLSSNTLFLQESHVVDTKNHLHLIEYEYPSEIRHSSVRRLSIFNPRFKRIFETDNGVWLFHPNSKANKCVFQPLKISPGKIEQLVQDLPPEQKYVTPPGTKVRVEIDVKGSAEIQKEVRAAVTQKLLENQLVIDPSANIKVTLSTSIQPTKERSYRKFGSFLSSAVKVKVTPHISSIIMYEGDEIVWRTGTNTDSSFISLNKGETIQQAVKRLEKTNYEFFKRVVIPEKIVRPLKKEAIKKLDITSL